MSHFQISFISVVILCFTQISQAQITFSEIMFDPVDSEHYYEFIEIYNLSDRDSVDVSGWQISDGTDSDKIIGVAQGTIIAPHQFAIVLDPGYFDNERVYDALVPVTALALTIDGSTFGSGGLSNSTPEMLSLIQTNGDTVSRYTYSLDNQEGYSDEKIVLSGPNTPDNWANSKKLRGTPGAKNSVSPVMYDVAIRLWFEPETPAAQSDVAIHATVRNSGTSPATNLVVTFYEDLNNDSIPVSEEMIAAPIMISDTLSAQDSAIVTVLINQIRSGKHSIIAQVDFPFDEDISNNTVLSSLDVSFQLSDLIINEIMYRPAANGAEWFEVFNPTVYVIDLYGWKFSDSRQSNKILITDQHLLLNPGDFIILAENNNLFSHFPSIPCPVLIFPGKFPALNDTYDSIVLYDLTDSIIDRVDYSSSWGKAYGVSLERISPVKDSNNPANWALCLNMAGGTPGEKNSVSPLDIDLAIRSSDIWFSPLKPVLGTPITIHTKIRNVGLLPAFNFQVEFYDDRNLDSTIQYYEQIGFPVFVSDTLLTEDSLTVTQTWTTYKSGKNQIIVNLSYAEDPNNSNNLGIRQLYVPYIARQIVINEVMFQPLESQPEWIELYNPGDSAIDLYDWKISDAVTKSVISARSQAIESRSYIILAQNAAISQHYQNIGVPVIALSPWPALNNDFDRVVLYDLTNTTIDSMVYFNKWNSQKGVSLERMDYLRASMDSSNWAPSLDDLGATPGSENSVSAKDYDLAVRELSFSNDQPQMQEIIEIYAIVANVGRQPTGTFTLSFFHDVNRDSMCDHSEQIGESVLFSGILQQSEAVKISTSWKSVPSGLQHIYAVLSASKDLNTANDRKLALLKVGFVEQCLVINEIMYSPFVGQPEWVELYNRSNSRINIQDWSLSDDNIASAIKLSSLPFFLEPESFLVVSADSLDRILFPQLLSSLIINSKLPGLNNDADAVILYDLNRNVIDYVRYQNSWGGGEGISLERINPDLPATDNSNWSSCVYLEGGTPEQKNSVFIKTLPSSTTISVHPNPFSPDADGVEDVTIIRYQLPMTTASIHIKIYDVRGRLVRFLCNNKSSGAEGYAIWDGKNDEGHVCRIGIYIIFLEALNAAQGVVVSHKKTVVLAARL